MALVTKEVNGKKQIAYDPPKDSVLMDKSNRLLEQFFKYANQIGLSPAEVCVQRSLLPRIILRVDKRESYFLAFHEGTRINEIKQAALTAYWILKFKPFMVNTSNPDHSYHFARINEGFAAFYILSTCTQYAIEKGIEPKQMTKRLQDELLYAFNYWDLSKEAVIMMAETIAEAFFGLPAQGMEQYGNN